MGQAELNNACHVPAKLASNHCRLVVMAIMHQHASDICRISAVCTGMQY